MENQLSLYSADTMVFQQLKKSIGPILEPLSVRGPSSHSKRGTWPLIKSKWALEIKPTNS